MNSSDSNSLVVFTCNYTWPPTDYALLQDSCARVGIDLQTYGDGQVWPSYTHRLRDAAAFLDMRTETHCLFLDSADTFICDDASELLERFYTFSRQFVFSAEKNCWPDASKADYFPGDGTPYRFLNAGAWMGKREYTVNMLRRVWSTYHYRPTFEQDDTRCFVHACIDGVIPADDYAIDHHCRIFHSMCGYVDGEIDAQLHNTITDTRPAVFHFNGRAPGREEFYNRLLVRETF